MVAVEVGGDAVLAVEVVAGGAVDLDPLVQEGGALCVRGRDGGKGYECRLAVWEMMKEAGGLAHILN